MPPKSTLYEPFPSEKQSNYKYKHKPSPGYKTLVVMSAVNSTSRFELVSISKPGPEISGGDSSAIGEILYSPKRSQAGKNKKGESDNIRVLVLRNILDFNQEMDERLSYWKKEIMLRINPVRLLVYTIIPAFSK